MSFATALGEGDQRGEAIYDVVRDRTASLYGIDLDANRAAHPESEEKRRLALRHTIDDHLAEKREREMREQASTVLARLQKDEFWAEADGAAVAHELAFADTLGPAHEQRKEIYDLVRERTNDEFSVDLDATLEQFPGSEERGRLALRRSIDESLASSEAEESQENDSSLAASLEARSEMERAADEPEADVTQEQSRDAAAEAHIHGEDLDRLLSSSRTEAAITEVEAEKAQAMVPTTAAGKARQEAGVSYPDGASESMTKGQQSSSKAAAPARVHGRDAGRVSELSR